MPWIVERSTHQRGGLGSYLELLLGVGVAHAALLDHGPEGGIVEVVDMAWGVSLRYRGIKNREDTYSLPASSSCSPAGSEQPDT